MSVINLSYKSVISVKMNITGLWKKIKTSIQLDFSLCIICRKRFISNNDSNNEDINLILF